MNFHFIDCEDVLRTPGRCEREKVKRGCLSGVMRKYCAKTCRVCGKLKRFVVYFDDIIRDSLSLMLLGVFTAGKQNSRTLKNLFEKKFLFPISSILKFCTDPV